MIKSCFMILFLATQTGCYSSETGSRAIKPEQADLSSKTLIHVDTLLQRYVNEKKMPGFVAMVARHGKIVFHETVGWMNAGKPMRPDAIFRLASMTKPITSLAVMMLYDEGRFRLDDPVSKYIPEFGNLKVFSSIDADGTLRLAEPIGPMTIRQLLTHVSGLGSGAGDNPVDSLYRAANLSEGTLKDMIGKLAGIPLLCQPGTRWNYGRSTDVLGYLVETISGKALDEFLKERIFDPLKMKDTDYHVPKEKLDRLAAVYSPGESGGIQVIHPDTGDITLQPAFLSGNGGLFSTAKDYMAFSQMLLNKGEYNGARLLKRETVDLMTSDQITNEIMPDDNFFGPMLSGMGFSCGFAVLRADKPSTTVGSPGSYWWSGTANTYFFIDPKEDMVLILMSQYVPNFHYPVFKEFKEFVYKAIVE